MREGGWGACGGGSHPTEMGGGEEVVARGSGGLARSRELAAAPFAAAGPLPRRALLPASARPACCVYAACVPRIVCRVCVIGGSLRCGCGTRCAGSHFSVGPTHVQFLSELYCLAYSAAADELPGFAEAYASISPPSGGSNWQ